MKSCIFQFISILLQWLYVCLLMKDYHSDKPLSDVCHVDGISFPYEICTHKNTNWSVLFIEQNCHHDIILLTYFLSL